MFIECVDENCMWPDLNLHIQNAHPLSLKGMLSLFKQQRLSREFQLLYYDLGVVETGCCHFAFSRFLILIKQKRES